MYSMKEACQKTNLSYQTLKFYCNEGLVPNVKRDDNNYRIFSDKDIEWISSLTCLKKCNFSIKEMKDYLKLCLDGPSTIPARKEMLKVHKIDLNNKIKELNDAVAYIEWKENFYDDVMSGKIEYYSNLIDYKE